ncbi:MAG: pantetheine-phosphate adenylyltransferase [Candidatus Firestonebacteria bacterium]
MKAIYPGSFDPITNGHLDIIKRGLRVFEHLTIAVVINTYKKPLFSAEERVRMIKDATKDFKNVTVDKFNGLLIDYVKKVKCNVVMRGLRVVSDFEYEFQMALTNRKLNKNMEIIYMMPSEEYIYLSSSMIKEIYMLGGNVSEFVPKIVIQNLKKHKND